MVCKGISLLHFLHLYSCLLLALRQLIVDWYLNSLFIELSYIFDNFFYQAFHSQKESFLTMKNRLFLAIYYSFSTVSVICNPFLLVRFFMPQWKQNTSNRFSKRRTSEIAKTFNLIYLSILRFFFLWSYAIEQKFVWLERKIVHVRKWLIIYINKMTKWTKTNKIKFFTKEATKEVN